MKIDVGEATGHDIEELAVSTEGQHLDADAEV